MRPNPFLSNQEAFSHWLALCHLFFWTMVLILAFELPIDRDTSPGQTYRTRFDDGVIATPCTRFRSRTSSRNFCLWGLSDLVQASSAARKEQGSPTKTVMETMR